MPRTRPLTDDGRARDGAPPHRRRRSAGPIVASSASPGAGAVHEDLRTPDRHDPAPVHRRISAAHRTPDPEASDERVAAGVLTEGRALLSPAEQRVAALLDTELTLAEIGTRLFLSRNTVKSHVRRIYRRLEVHDRQGAVGRLRSAQTRPAASGDAGAPQPGPSPLVLAHDRAAPPRS